jgi:hypothetical protein
MRLKDIYEVGKNEDTQKLYSDTWNNLKTKYANEKGYIKRDMIFDDLKTSSGYARSTYSGKIRQGIKLNELELSMICDNGYSHFGRSSSIGQDGSFSVTIYTD